MRGRTVAAQGTYFELGQAHGRGVPRAIRHNLAGFWRTLERNGYGQEKVRAQAWLDRTLLPPHRREELDGLARGSDLPLRDLLAFNLYHGLVSPDECTSMCALPSATATGETIFFKNSDKVGGSTLVGPEFHLYKEVNVILALHPKDGNRLIGSSAAGSLGIKMGLNDKGVAVGSNISRTQELKDKKVNLTTLRAADRAELGREALEVNSALEACQRVLQAVTQNPMGTPGNMEFADAKECWIVEGSYDKYAVEVVRQGVCARANRFVLLAQLNQWDDVSSEVRYIRSLQLLRAHEGKITADLVRSFSMDHENGPGLNSICRHSPRPEDETSLSAAVMEINAKQPERSRIHLALGKPCHAWREKEAHVVLEMTTEPEAIPAGFRDGSVFKKFYTEEPRLD
ncbi:MAG: hypothetical protein HYV08_01690 [Deltaproteobacteria bacterium]|nr:hypothetical protein [Deltaproteobacteria bacterium]